MTPMKDKSVDEQIRFASEYTAARTRASGGDLRKGLAAYGEGDKYAASVLGRIGSPDVPAAAKKIETDSPIEPFAKPGLASMMTGFGGSGKHQPYHDSDDWKYSEARRNDGFQGTFDDWKAQMPEGGSSAIGKDTVVVKSEITIKGEDGKPRDDVQATIREVTYNGESAGSGPT